MIPAKHVNFLQFRKNQLRIFYTVISFSQFFSHLEVMFFRCILSVGNTPCSLGKVAAQIYCGGDNRHDSQAVNKPECQLLATQFDRSFNLTSYRLSLLHMLSSEMCRKIQNSGLCDSSLIIYFLTKLKKSPQSNFEVSTEWSNGKNNYCALGRDVKTSKGNQIAYCAFSQRKRQIYFLMLHE